MDTVRIKQELKKDTCFETNGIYMMKFKEEPELIIKDEDSIHIDDEKIVVEQMEDKILVLINEDKLSDIDDDCSEDPLQDLLKEQYLENRYRLNWNCTIVTDKTVTYNRPDIVFADKFCQYTYLIDVAVLNTNNLMSVWVEKVIRTWTDLAEQVKSQWKQKIAGSGIASSLITYGDHPENVGAEHYKLHLSMQGKLQKAVKNCRTNS